VRTIDDRFVRTAQATTSIGASRPSCARRRLQLRSALRVRRAHGAGYNLGRRFEYLKRGRLNTITDQEFLAAGKFLHGRNQPQHELVHGFERRALGSRESDGLVQEINAVTAGALRPLRKR
jgi:hypothetical protein